MMCIVLSLCSPKKLKKFLGQVDLKSVIDFCFWSVLSPGYNTLKHCTRLICWLDVQIQQFYNKTLSFYCLGKGNVDLYSASSRTPLTRSDMDHTMLPANNTISAFTRKHSPGGATTHKHIANAWVQLTTHLSTPRGWMAEFAVLADIQLTVYPEDVTRQPHAMVQAR